MEDNPYSTFVNIIRDGAGSASTATYRIGRVESGNPLAVDIGGALQGASSIVGLSRLLTISVSVNVANEHTHSATASASEQGFSKGDMLLLIPIEEEQRYIVMGKLVGL